MNGENRYKIPAASIGDTDLEVVARTNLDAAKEIARLEYLMNRGEETKDEFLSLCQLLFDIGSVADSEYLLRRNIDYYEGERLCSRLFGTTKQEEFDAAIEAFGPQFDTQLSLSKKNDFLVSTFHSDGGPPRSDIFRMLSQPCEVIISYAEKDTIDSDVTFLEPIREGFNPEEYLVMNFVNGVWELTDT